MGNGATGPARARKILRVKDLRLVRVRRAGAAFLAAASALLAGAGMPEGRKVLVSRIPPDYAENVPAAKAELVKVINEERKAHGAPPLAYDLLGAKVGDLFCEDAARNRTSGHWDLSGRAPYLRWALAGGYDHHGQNFAAESRGGYDFTEPPAVLLKKMHAAFMAEEPPNDGHRKTVLDPIWTHVGIGYAVVGREMRMTEEYSRRVLEWVELPSGPLPAGKKATIAFRLPKGWSVGGVEIAWEAVPRPLSREEIAARSSYGLPAGGTMLRPYPPPGSTWTTGEKGSFRASMGGRVEVAFPLERGPGHYYAIVYGAEGEAFGKRLLPLAAPLVVAE